MFRLTLTLILSIFTFCDFCAAQENAPRLETRAYQIADLIIPSPLGAQLSQAVTTGKIPKKEIRIQDAAPLIDLIKQTIEPETWSPTNPLAGTISFSKDKLCLVVTNKRTVQTEIADLLEKLRDLNDVQIQINGLLIVVSKTELEKQNVKIPATPAKISQRDADLLYGLAVTTDSADGYIFEPRMVFNGQSFEFEFKEIAGLESGAISLTPISGRDRESVNVVANYRSALTGDTESQSLAAVSSGQSMAIDVSNILPREKSLSKAILVFRPYVMELGK